MISITSDVDWAPSPVIEDMVDLLDDYNVRGTIFSTHDDGLALDDHERGIHPNFFKDMGGEQLTDKSQRAVLEEILEIFPEATGTRSHCLYTNSLLQFLYPDLGIQYESNFLMELQTGLEPFWMGDYVLQFPIYWEDDVWMRSDRTPPDAGELIAPAGLKVFNFHPFHVYMNSPSMEYIEEMDVDSSDPNSMLECRYEGDGARTIFKDLLVNLEKSDEEVKPLGELADEIIE